MLDHGAFSALRLIDLFAEEPSLRAGWRGSSAIRSFDWEYLGGLWDTDQVGGVTFGIPEVDPSKLGFIELDHQAPQSAPSPAQSNAARVLERLGLPVRFGDGRAKVEALANGQEPRQTWYANQTATLEFDHGDSSVYRMVATVHDRDGLLSLTIIRPDLAEQNERPDDSGPPEEDG